MVRSDLPYPWMRMQVPGMRGLLIGAVVGYSIIGILIVLTPLFFRISQILALLWFGMLILAGVLFGKDLRDRWKNGLEHPYFCVCALRPENYNEADITFRIRSEFGEDVGIKPMSRPIHGMGKMRPIDLHGHRIYLSYRDYFLFQNASIYFGPVRNRSDLTMIRRLDSILYDVKFRRRDYQKIADDMMKAGV